MELLFLILTSIVFYLFFLHGLDIHRKRRLPPGPIGLPIIGNLLQLGPNLHESLATLAQKHGPFMTVRLGPITTVVASTPAAAREILQRKDDACSGRVMQESITALDNPEAAILWMPPDETWRALRKSLNMNLTNHKKLNTLTYLRHKVVAEMVDFLRKNSGTAVDIGKLAFSVVLNQMSNSILSQNVTAYESENVGELKTSMDSLMKIHGTVNVADIFPVLKPLDPQNIRGKVRAAYSYLDQVIEGFVSRRLKHRQSELPRFDDLLDTLLDCTQDSQPKFNLVHVNGLTRDLFVAGTHTTSTTITWAMTELLRHPDMLLRVRQEVEQTVGEDGKVNEVKILDLPYLQAVIKETLRLHIVVPFLAPHKTEMEIKLGEFIVPRNTQILVNSWAIARDPKDWENPTVFMPERFLRNKVDYKGQHFEFIPFGSGKRICPGMHLVHRMGSLMIASFAYHFDWKLPHDKDDMDMDTVPGITISKAKPLVATPIPLK